MIEYIASDGMVWDWKEPHYNWDPVAQEAKQVHLYAKILYIGNNDSIDNYIEINEPN